MTVESGRLAIEAFRPAAKEDREIEPFDSVEILRKCGWPAVDLRATPVVEYRYEDLRPNPLRTWLLAGGSVVLGLALVIKMGRRALNRGSAGKAA